MDTGACLVLGVNGQDGSFAAEKFLEAGWRVIGVGRQEHSKWVPVSSHFEYFQIDLACFAAVEDMLQKRKPAIIFNAAAVHGAATFFYEDVWLEAHQVNVLLTHGVLEYLRKSDSDCSYLFLTSSKVFDLESHEVISEESNLHSDCIYSITKNSATELIRYYRHKYSVNANIVWTFNHESCRRSGDFFIPKLVHMLASSIENPEFVGEIYNLDFWCDWGDAEEFMAICCNLVQKFSNVDLVIATGAPIYARDLAANLFSSHGLSYEKHIRVINPTRWGTSASNAAWEVDLSILTNKVEMAPTRNAYDVCKKILSINYPSTKATN